MKSPLPPVPGSGPGSGGFATPGSPGARRPVSSVLGPKGVSPGGQSSTGRPVNPLPAYSSARYAEWLTALDILA